MATLNLALDLAVNATSARTTVQSPYQWNGSINWKDDYSNPDKLSEKEIRQRRKSFDEAKLAAQQNKS